MNEAEFNQKVSSILRRLSALETWHQSGSMYADDVNVTIPIASTSAYYPVTSGFLESGGNGAFRFDEFSKLICVKPGVYDAVWSMSLAAGNNDHVEGGIMVNTTALIDSLSAGHTPGAGDEVPVSGTGHMTLNAGDYVRLCVQNEIDTDSIIMTHANLALWRSE